MSFLGFGKEVEDTSNGVTNVTNGLRYMFTGDVDPKILAELDKIDKEHVTARWKADAMIPWYKSSRSIVLLWLTLVYTLFIILDSLGVTIKEYWVESITGLMMVVFGAFFGGKSLELINGRKV